MSPVVISVLSLIVILGVLVFVHELGHFVAAKWAGIYVHRFSIGMGKPIRRLSFRRGETEYAIGWLPLGAEPSIAGAVWVAVRLQARLPRASCRLGPSPRWRRPSPRPARDRGRTERPNPNTSRW